MKNMARKACMASSNSMGVQIELTVDQTRIMISLDETELVEPRKSDWSNRRRKIALPGAKSSTVTCPRSPPAIETLRTIFVLILTNSHITLVIEKGLCMAFDLSSVLEPWSRTTFLYGILWRRGLVATLYI